MSSCQDNYMNKLLLRIILLLILIPILTRAAIIIPDNRVVIKAFGVEQTTLLPQTFNLTVWNIYKAKKNSWTRDIKSILRGSDVILTQEFLDSKKVINSINESGNLHSKMAISFYDTKKKLNTGVATISKYHVHASKFLH